ncbi:MAG: MFS transporter [Gammaproteobacteria bacterium]
MIIDATLQDRKSYAVIGLVFATALFQGLTLVSFPALASLLKASLGLSDTSYGTLFLPQVALTAVSAVAGGLLSAKWGLPALLRYSLAANGLSQLALLAGVAMGGNTGYVSTVLGTTLLGVGFGLSAAPLNRYPILFFPGKSDSALAALHTFIGAGLALGPVLTGMLVQTGHWQAFPVALAALSAMLLLGSWAVRFSEEQTEARTDPVIGASTALARSPAFWLLAVVAVVYAFCEGLFSNWAVIYLQEDKGASAETAGAALSAFWTALAAGRLMTSWLATRMPSSGVWLGFPVLMAGAFLSLSTVDSGFSAIAAYAFAGLACSGFFPLTVGRVSARFPTHQALVSSLMVAALMLGVGLGSFTLGPLRSVLSLTALFHLAAGLPLLVFVLGLFSLFPSRAKQQLAAVFEEPRNAVPIIEAGAVFCPACGGENAADAVFCGNAACHKALGEFKYVLEELLAEKNWIERFADRVTLFVSKPHFITLHMLWFMIWIAINSGILGYFQRFDEYPYDFLGIILSIEAILITGFLLISQNHQTAYSEKRAELDYEITIRSYRKLIELERRLNQLAGDDRNAV